MAQEKRCLPRLMASREEGQGSRPAAQDASPRARRGPGSANLPRRVTAAPPTSWTSHPSPVKQPVGCGKEEQPALRRRVPSLAQAPPSEALGQHRCAVSKACRPSVELKLGMCGRRW